MISFHSGEMCLIERSRRENTTFVKTKAAIQSGTDPTLVKIYDG